MTTTKEVVINACFGGFGVSKAALEHMKTLGYKKDSFDESARENKYLIQAIKDLGSAVCSARYGKLVIVKIPANVEYTIQEYDGYEHIAEKHRTWYESSKENDESIQL